MPVTFSSKRGSSERTYQIAMDWTRRVLQLAAVGAILLYAYLLYGLFMGDIGHWSTLAAADKIRIAGNIDGAINYLNMVLGVLLLTVCILFYDEEATGYVLVAGSVALYYGLPLLIDLLLSGQLKGWEAEHNKAALAIMNQFKILALMLAVPGGILALRDLVLRVVDGSARKRDEFSAMQYGGAVKEEEDKPVGGALGVFAKCWQLPFCRPAIRKNCPIYHARTKCWKERVGCMCEENVVRQAMDAIISKEMITTEDSFIKKDEEVIEGIATAKTVEEKTAEIHVTKAPPTSKRNVKIPHNPNLSNHIKRERCRNCVIYNEHQRKKYQFVAPLFVIAIPLFTYLQIDAITTGLNRVLHGMDSVMSKLSLASGNSTSGVMGNIFAGAGVAQYIVIGCLVVIVTTMSLRFLEFMVFKLKI